jgi:hypothetical protein
VFNIACGDDGNDGAAIAPKTLTWTLLNKPGDIINDREDEVVASPTASEDVVLSGADLALISGETASKVIRVFIVEGTYDCDLTGGELPLKARIYFTLENYEVGDGGTATLAGADAEDIAFTPYGGLAAVSVGAALRELDDEKGAAGAIGAWGVPTEKTIVSGVVTLNGEGYYEIDTEGDADSDTVTQILGLIDGDEVIWKPANDGRTVIVANGANIILNNGADFTLNSIYDRMRLQCIGSNKCVELSRSSGGS